MLNSVIPFNLGLIPTFLTSLCVAYRRTIERLYCIILGINFSGCSISYIQVCDNNTVTKMLSWEQVSCI